jgi:hypothetical protein
LHSRLYHFVKQLKEEEELSVDIVVVSVGWAKVKPNVQEDIDYVIAHPHVIRWFIQNLDLYGGNPNNNNNNYTTTTTQHSRIFIPRWNPSHMEYRRDRI